MLTHTVIKHTASNFESDIVDYQLQLSHCHICYIFLGSNHIDLDHNTQNEEENTLLLRDASVPPEDSISNTTSDNARLYNKQMVLITTYSLALDVS